jgi:plasmid maintenance system antidote protein VapI
MLPSHRIAKHPGEILLQEFLEPLGLTQAQATRSSLARSSSFSRSRLAEIT